MYDEIGDHFSRTRQKTYGTNSTNWPVTDKYLAQLKSGQTVLDIGCGNGKLVSGLPDGVTYLGTDFSKTLLEEARRLYPDHEFILGNVIDEDHWRDLGSYDSIFCVAVLHHIPEREQQLFVLRKAKSHLANGGFLYLTVWNLSQEKFAKYKTGDHYEIPYNKDWKRYCVSYNISTMSDLMKEAGLDVAEIFYADREGKKADMSSGENLVCVANMETII